MKLNHPDKLTPEALQMLHGYKLELAMLAQTHEENTGQLSGLPSTDFAIRHALAVAIEATRTLRKEAQGELT